MAKAPRKSSTARGSGGATVGYEAQLWQMADALRGSMDAAEYKHVCLGLLFLKYISDAFEEKHAALLAEKAQGADPEDPDEYRAQSIFWVPPEARWSHLKAQARQSTIGQLVDDAMAGIERDNPALKGVLPKDYARPALDKQRLGQLIDMISNLTFTSPLPQGEGQGEGGFSPTCPVSARARRWMRCASTATCSRPAVTSVLRPRWTTASRSKRRCGGSPRRSASSRPRPRSSRPPLPPT